MSRVGRLMLVVCTWESLVFRDTLWCLLLPAVQVLSKDHVFREQALCRGKAWSQAPSPQWSFCSLGFLFLGSLRPIGAESWQCAYGRCSVVTSGVL